jgi:hypothetical protein
MICSHECTFCLACAGATRMICPNCGGELVRRPLRRALGSRLSCVPLVALLALLALPALAAAQSNVVATAVRRNAEPSGKYLLAAAEAMPADRYGFRPTPAQMTFGALIAHIQGDNRTTCAALSGLTPEPEEKIPATASKEKLVAALRRSIQFCDRALARLDDATLGETVTWYGEKTTRATAAIGLVTDWADHYGQQAIYLRLNGVLPPTAR